ncbi:MAG: RDD family protein [Deltaproteobacteria bacterium]|nr:RDD family protein [Deltaproteobacteria bacterium]
MTLESHEKKNIMTVRTPEGIAFSFHLASPVTRFLAWIIDFLCIIALSKLIGTGSGMIGMISRDVASATAVLSYFIVSIGYGIVMEYYWRGQTLGKRLFNLRVTDEQGLHLRFSQVVIRNLLRFVDNLPLLYLVGGLSCLISPRAQRLGDIAANTIVVRNPKILEPDIDQIRSDKYNSFNDYPHLAARLRQSVSSRAAGIALQALLRRQHLEPRARLELFEEIAAYFKKMVPFPQEATDGISDEQYIRNVMEVLFSPGSPPG